MAPSSEPPNGIFDSIRYFIASSLPLSRAEELRHVLDLNGATYADQGLRDPTLTTIVTNSNRFEGWEDISQRQGVEVVTDKWVERSVILGKIQLPQHYSADPAMIFSGIVGCACELPSADLEVLSAGITALGGQWRSGLTKDVTHLFALNSGSTKYSTAMHYREETGVRVILPHWFDDAVRLGMGGLSTKPYEWPDPEILKGIDSLTAGKDNTKGKGKAPARSTVDHDDVKLNLYATAAIFTPSHGRSSPPSEADISLVLNAPIRGAQPSDIRTMQVWNGRKILLSRTLELYKGRREAVHIGIERAGGTVLRFDGDEDEPEDLTEQEKKDGKELSRNERIRRQNEAQQAEDCDILVTRWRYGRAYVRACKAGKIIGTLAWLFHVQSTGILSNPQDQLLHYPMPKQPIEAFSSHVITVTNYTGEAREYLKKLIYTMGAKFTPSMSGQNTVLIAAFIDGAKAAKAQSWSIPVVNHTWLEDCFIQWRNLTVGLEKYIVFPPGVNFCALLGERGVGVGSNVSSGIDDLATTVFEEDEPLEPLRVEEPDKPAEDVMEIDIPQGTEESAKEVANGLVDDDTENRPSKPRSKPRPQPKQLKKHEKLVAPAGMDVEFEPPSTAAIANQVDWDVGFNELDQDQLDEEDEVLTVTKKAAKSKSLPKLSKKKTPAKVAVDESGEEEEEEEEEEEDVSRKTRSKKSNVNVEASKRSDEEEDEELPVVVSKKMKREEGKKQVNGVSKSKGLTHRRLSKGKASKFSGSESSDDDTDEEDEEEEEETTKNTRSKVSSRSNVNATSPSANTRSRTSTKKQPEALSATKPKKNSKTKRLSLRSDSDREPESRHKKPKSPISTSASKTQKKRRPTPSDKSDSEEEEDQQPKTSARPNLSDKTARKTHEGRAKEDDSPQRPSSSAAAHSTPNKSGNMATGKGLLKMAKGDARTRVKKKTGKAGVERLSVESEEEEEEEVEEKGKKSGKKVATTSDEDEIRPSKSKPRTATSKDKKGKAPSRPQRSKPLRVYSSENVESEDDTIVSAANDKPESEGDGTDDDDELPSAVVASTSRKKNAAPGTTTTAQVKSKQRTSSNGPQTKLRASTTASKQLTSTPKRTVSVLVPSLTISGGSKKGTGKSDPTTTKNKIQRKISFEQTTKAKSKFRTPVTDSSDEVEVEEIISPRTRAAVSKDASLKNLAGQSSLKDVVNHNKKGKGLKAKKAAESSSITVTRKPSKTALPEPMEVDDDNVRGSTPGSITSYALPRRSAATKASQTLHEKVMPDLVNFEAQMKKSKGKGRQSGSLTAFALDIEKDRAQDTGKRKSMGHQENEEDSGGEQEQPKKKRRISDENDREHSKPKSKGKQKAKNDDEGDASGSSSVVLLTTQVTLSDEVVRTLTKLGVQMTTRPVECTHLLAPHLVRTEKFLCALACAPFILSVQWATASAAAKKLLPEKGFILKDEAGEKKYGTDLSQALRRAKSNKGKLLDGKMFYVTPRVAIDKKLLKNVVNALGGQVTNQTPSLRIISANPEMRHVISCKEDISIWRPIAAQGYKVYNQELLLAGAMKQKMEWERPEFIIDS